MHIGSAKENEFYRGQDYIIDSGKIKFFNANKIQKKLTAEQIKIYSVALIQNNVIELEKILKPVCSKHPELVYSESDAFAISDSIKKHISDVQGNLYIPGSSIKGALRSIFGVYLKDKHGLKGLDNLNNIFGGINNNFMRLVQTTDILFEQNTPKIIPTKIFSADIEGNYNSENISGTGQWKHNRIGGHSLNFKNEGFVTLAECIDSNAESFLRLNFGEELLEFIKKIDNNSSPFNSQYLNDIAQNKWLDIAKNQMNQYIDAEIAFFNTFKNDALSDYKEMWNELKKMNNNENSVLIRLGSGSGYHAITGNWKFTSNHINTGQATKTNKEGVVKLNTINYKTRKVAFDNENFYFPGFVLLTLATKEEYDTYLQALQSNRSETSRKYIQSINDFKEKEARAEAEIEEKIKAEAEAKAAETARIQAEALAREQAKAAEEAEYQIALTTEDLDLIKKYIEENPFKVGIEEVRRRYNQLKPTEIPIRLKEGKIPYKNFIKEAKDWKKKSPDVFDALKKELEQLCLKNYNQKLEL